MSSMLGYPCRRALAIVLGATLCSAPAWASNVGTEEDKGVADHTSEYVRDYLSDPRRVGALAGGILGSALTAHPAGSVVGSMIGFFIGKQSMFNEDEAREQRSELAAARRDIIPAQGAADAVPTLSFSNPQAVTFSNSTPAVEVGAPMTALAMPAPAAPSAPLAPTPAAAPMPAARSAPALQAQTPPVPLAAPLPAPAIAAAPVPAAAPGAPPAVPLMIAAICGGGMRVVDPRLRSMCFYNQAD